ncbi:MAG: glycerol-3-phosphate 1-O-acyltransferase PlsY [Lysobacterales bacterium]
MAIVLLIGKLGACYLLGSLSGSLLLGRLRGVDLRQLGSGNAGGTNAFRTQGFAFALWVVLIDIGKGALAVPIGRFGIADETAALQSGLLALAAAIAGHVWPLFFGFRGGKGAATLVGGLLTLAPSLLLLPIAVWLLTLMLTGYVGLATVLTGLCFLPSSWFLSDAASRPTWIAASIVIAVFLLFTHRENMRRLSEGSEHRFDGARLLHRWWAKARPRS